MAENSKIQWTTHTFNPWRGCTKIAPGCANCYADATSRRNPGTLGIWGPGGIRVVASEAMWKKPEKWNVVRAEERPRVFCASFADVFEEWTRQMRMSGRADQPPKWANNAGRNGRSDRFVGVSLVGGSSATMMHHCRERLFRLIDATPNLDWLLLTKRPENIRAMWPGGKRANVWLGTSIATQADADRNIPLLSACRDLCSVLFVSGEPLVAPVDLTAHLTDPAPQALAMLSGFYRNPDGTPSNFNPKGDGARVERVVKSPLPFDWFIAGGESGSHSRPCEVDWIRNLTGQCKRAGVACFNKQLGAHVIDRRAVGDNHSGIPGDECWPSGQATKVDAHGRVFLRDKKGGDISEWPEDLRVREFPRVAA